MWYLTLHAADQLASAWGEARQWQGQCKLDFEDSFVLFLLLSLHKIQTPSNMLMQKEVISWWNDLNSFCISIFVWGRIFVGDNMYETKESPWNPVYIALVTDEPDSKNKPTGQQHAASSRTYRVTWVKMKHILYLGNNTYASYLSQTLLWWSAKVPLKCQVVPGMKKVEKHCYKANRFGI